MSKRYGRRQKRQHRERIAALETAVATLQTRVALADRRATHAEDEVRARESELRAWDDEIHRLLGRYSAFRRQTKILAHRGPLHAMPVPTSADALRKALMTYGAFSEAHLDRVLMQRFIVEIEEDRSRLSRYIRLVHVDNGSLNYAISEPMLRDVGFGPREEQHLAEQIAKIFAARHNERLPERRTAARS